ncbi:MAG: alpha/beta hydrolase family protein [Georgenia sp.]
MIDDDHPDIGVREPLPYGSWPSPVTAETLTEHAVSLSEPMIDGESVYWLEERPEEGGRVALVRRQGDITAEVPGAVPDGSAPDVRTRVYEYGGGACTVRDGTLVFSHAPDGRLYRLDVGRGRHAAGVTAAVPLTPPWLWRLAEPVVDVDRGLVYAVREDHGVAAAGEPANELVAIPLDGSAAETGTGIRVLVSGHDFVASPALSEDGARLAWITWEHPDMPWTSSQLHVGTLTPDGMLGGVAVLAGGSGVSVAQPVWTPAGDLVHVDDSSGWWNLYRTEGIGEGHPRTRDLHPSEAEFARPRWRGGDHDFAVLDADHLVSAWTSAGRWHVGTVRLANGELEEWRTGWEPVGGLAAADGRAVLVAGLPTRPPAVIELDLEQRDVVVLRESSEVQLAAEDVSVAREMSWHAADGATVHGFFYPPTSARYAGPDGELPPLLVLSHGGPTSATRAALSMPGQFWSSRGFAVLDVNYGGSTGFGRAYRERLDGAWGVVDVADCASGAEHLADLGLVDRARLGIRGGSAGGFTTLAALTFTDVFTAGASRYGVGDLAALARDTHKFESHYTYGLVGPYPEQEARYRERSPIHHTDRLSAPMVLLQGTEDNVVPPAQAEQMADAVRAKGLPVALVMFEGEAHGFRSAEHIRAAALAELSFFAQVWGIEPAGDVPLLAVENLPQRA